MSYVGKLSTRFLHSILFIGLVIVLRIPARSSVLAQNNSLPVRVVRVLQLREYEVDEPRGLAFSPPTNNFLVWEADGNMTAISMHGEPAGRVHLDETVEEPLNLAFDNSTNSLFVLKWSTPELVQMPADQGSLSLPSPGVAAHYNLQALDLRDAKGITLNPDDGRLFILEGKEKQIVVIHSNQALGLQAMDAAPNSEVQTIDIPLSEADQLRGIAYNPQNGHLVIANPDQGKLYELSEEGQVLSTYDLRPLGLQETGNLLFAPSVDGTDDPNNMNLFLLYSGQSAASGGQIVELSLAEPAALPSGTPLLPTTLVRKVDMSNAAWSPSSPDPSGIDYWPRTGRFLITDSEVDEMPPYWAGANVFDATTSGSLVSTCNTIPFTDEPSGLAINPQTNRIYISDDRGGGKLFEVSLGPDGRYCTADDTVTIATFATDLEDVAYGNNMIFLAGGIDAEVWMFSLGPNGVLGGGDDGPLSHFDTAVMGFHDLEGIGYNADAGTLFIVSTQGSERYVGEVNISGTLLRAYDVSFMGTASNLRSDVTYAPSSQNPAVKNIYIVSRGIDNNSHPYENDGKWWEISLSSSPPTTPPPPTPAPIAGSTWYISSTGNFIFGESADIPVPADYNGDRRVNIAVYRPSNGTWYISTRGNFIFGEAGDMPMAGDYNGDGTDDIAIYRPSNGTWYISTLGNFQFGQPGDTPLPVDYNGDGRDDIAVYRPSNGTWYISTLGNFQFGELGDIPVPADYNGDGKADIAVFRPSNGTWYISSAGNFVFGRAGDIPVPADYNGDGRDDIAVYRPSNNTWYISSVGNFVYGESGDVPLAADYNGDGKADIAVYRP